MAATNFIQWNPGAANQENDATYNSDSQRSGGATNGAIFASVLGNKLFYQVTIFPAALCAALVAKGYSPNDGSASPGSALANLTAVLANILTNADLQNSGSPYAGMLVATPTIADNSHLVANTNFIRQQNFVASPAGGLLIQRGTSSSSSAFQTITFGTPFSGAPTVSCTGVNPAAPPVGIVSLNSTPSTTGFSVNCSDCTGFHWIAIGPA